MSKVSIQISSTRIIIFLVEYSARNNSKGVCNNFLLFGLASIYKNIFIPNLKSRLGLRACSTRLNLPYMWS